MRKTHLAVVAALAIVMALFLGWWLRPDTGGEVVAAPPRAPLEVQPVPTPEAPAPPLRSPEAILEVPARVPPLPERTIPPPPAVDPDFVYEPDIDGLANALLSRQQRLVSCYQTYREVWGDVPGRLTLKVTVLDVGEAMGVVSAGMPLAEPGAESFDQCVTDALADAQFAAPQGGSMTIMYPLPIPRPPPPTDP